MAIEGNQPRQPASDRRRNTRGLGLPRLGGAVLGAALLLAAWSRWLAADELQAAGAPTGPPADAAAAGHAKAAMPARPLQPAAGKTGRAGVLADLRERFGPHIHRPHAQIRSLEQIISYLRERHPDDWEAQVLAFLQDLFPDDADALYRRFQSLMQYNDWLQLNRPQLRRLSAAERREQLWAARYQAFGPDADAIWAAERRSQALGDALQALPAEQPASRQLEHFLTAVDDIYGEQAPRLLQQRRSELLGRFLERPAVQEELRQHDPETRQRTLRALRRQVGMDEQALERWDALDRHRDATWKTGQHYMAERARIIDEHSDADAQWRIDALRQAHFGELAAVLRAEEETGFFRFARDRRFGRE